MDLREKVKKMIIILDRMDGLGFNVLRMDLALSLTKYMNILDLDGLATSHDADLMHDCGGILRFGSDLDSDITFKDCWDPRYGK